MDRREFEMSEADLEELLDASKPVVYMVFGGVPPRSPRENANAAWRCLGERMGFDWTTVMPSRADQRFFTAAPAR